MTMTQVAEEGPRVVLGADGSHSSQQTSPQRRIVLTMDLPSLCPLCDSERVHYTYLSCQEASGIGRLVFRCTDCRSYVEAPVSDFDPPTGGPQPASVYISTQRVEQIDAGKQQPTAPHRSQAR